MDPTWHDTNWGDEWRVRICRASDRTNIWWEISYRNNYMASGYSDSVGEALSAAGEWVKRTGGKKR